MYKRPASLSPRALKAINYYMMGWDKAVAMRKAGYAVSSSKGNDRNFWKSKAVQGEIKERMRKLAVKTDITVESLVHLLSELLVVHPGDLVDGEGKQISASAIPSHVARALNWKMT